MLNNNVQIVRLRKVYVEGSSNRLLRLLIIYMARELPIEISSSTISSSRRIPI
jgi:hypothetical protein